MRSAFTEQRWHERGLVGLGRFDGELERLGGHWCLLLGLAVVRHRALRGLRAHEATAPFDVPSRGPRHHGAMASPGSLSAGEAALAEGRWNDALVEFAAALDAPESADAHLGMAAARWWLCDGRSSVR